MENLTEEEKKSIILKMVISAGLLILISIIGIIMLV